MQSLQVDNVTDGVGEIDTQQSSCAGLACTHPWPTLFEGQEVHQWERSVVRLGGATNR